MKPFNNPEVKKELALLLLVTFILSVSGFIINVYCGISVLTVAALFIVIFLLIARKRYMEIEQLSDDISNLLHGYNQILITENDEGELAILKNEISKMIIRLKEQSDLLLKDKKYLSDSIADIFHQIRTPLTSLILNVEILKNEDLSYEKRISIAKQSDIQLAVANVFNTISTNIYLRRREFAMLRSIGLSESSFRKMLNYECIIYGIRSLVWGVPISLLITWGIWQVSSSAFDIAFFIPWQSLVIAIGSVFLVVFITMFYASRRIRRENMIDALKTEII